MIQQMRYFHLDVFHSDIPNYTSIKKDSQEVLTLLRFYNIIKKLTKILEGKLLCMLTCS